MQRVGADDRVEARGREVADVCDAVLDPQCTGRSKPRDVDLTGANVDRGHACASTSSELARKLARSAPDLEHLATQRNAGKDPAHPCRRTLARLLAPGEPVK